MFTMNRLWFYISIIDIFFLCVANSLVTPEEWRNYKSKYGKSYDTKELDEMHLRSYEKSKEECEKNNKLYEERRVNFKMAINEYSDKIEDMEILQSLAELNPDLNDSHMVFRSGTIGEVIRPPGYKTYDQIVEENLDIDWRQRHAVSPVGNQKDCNSCWAFSSTGALEAQMRIHQNKMVNLSPKNLLDCSTANRGCKGGWVRRAYDYIIATGGIAHNESYPYVPKEDFCKYSNQSSAGTLRGIETLTMGDEKLMAETVYNIGPVTASIDFNHVSFQNYMKGVYVEPKCKNTKMDILHSVLVVGFGTDWREGDYWIVKNSYGKSWGIDGYMLMARNRNNMCGIATLPQYPIL